ncbi:MAG TPA: aspartate aminotransferase family protein [Candidatus Bathyarchaeia archaeon]|nr:aspartate aminotransferase family protein [Candidatus Bathyarchaeia archaeon]
MVDAIIERDAASLGSVMKIRFYPMVVDRAEGVRLWDVDGKEYLDFLAGWAVANTGYCHPRIVEAVTEQVKRTTHVSTASFPNEPSTALAEKLIKITPGKDERKVVLGVSGSDANDCVFKILPLYTGRPKIISFVGAYHGMTSGSLALSGHSSGAKFPSAANVIKTPYAYCYRCHLGLNYPSCNIQCVETIEDTIFKSISPNDVAAIIIEPIQSDGGDVVPPKEWAGRIRRICDRNDIFLVDDEIKVGFGRTGRMFAIERSHVVPEIVTVGKSLASGLPLSAVIAEKNILDLPGATHLFTTAGNPICCAAALATIEIIEKERLCEKAAKIGGYMKKRLNEIAQKHPLIGDVRGEGLILGLELVKNTETKEPAARETAKVCYRAWENGLILGYVGQNSNIVEITPPLILSEEDAEQGLQTLETTFSEVKHGKVSDEKITRFAGW